MEFASFISKYPLFSLLVLTSLYGGEARSQESVSFGPFGGVNFPVTIDQGLIKDPRFSGKFSVRGTPVGFSYGVDKMGYGFVVTPQLMTIGQTFTISNTVGGEVGKREIQMNYLSLPVGLKIHISDLAFSRFSLVASLAPSMMIRGRELITHEASKLRYPASVLVPADPAYIKTFDGVVVPEVNNQEYVSANKFNAFNLFAALGFRSDIEFLENWAVSVDGRANFGIFDTRTSDYREQLRAPADAPDLFGERREVFLSVTFGISRILTIKKDFKPKPFNRKNAAYKSILYRNAPKPNN